MLSINTNLSSLIVQGNLKQSTNSLNTAIERMTTGCKLNHASDNAANYSIKTNMDTKIGAYMVAEDNTAMGIDLLTTAESSLSLIGDKLARLRTLAVQSSNGTYGTESQKAINSEANALIDEMQRLHSTTEYNGKKLLGASENSGNSASVKMSPVKFTRRDTTNMKKLGEIEDASVALADGTYSISTAAELAQLAEMTNAGLISEGDEFVLANDIDLSAYATGEGWTPIGTSATKFAGTFDGNGHTITNLYINRPSSNYQGLFGDSKGCLKNVNIVDAEMNCLRTSGILTGVQRGDEIINCTTSGSIIVSEYSVGGIAGQFFGKMENCSSNVEINSSGGRIRQLGGLIGQLSGGDVEIEFCYSKSKINGSDKIGGLIGTTSSSVTSLEISNCYADTQITTKNIYTDGSFVGGFIAAVNGSVNINNCYSTGSIIGESGATQHSYIAGFLGASEGSVNFFNIKNCSSSVDLILQDDSVEIYRVGGFMGQLGAGEGAEVSITDCYSTGDITISALRAYQIGGFVAVRTNWTGNSFISNCYSTGDITISSSDSIVEIGSFLGRIGDYNANFTNCYTIGNMYIENDVAIDNIGGFAGYIDGQKNNNAKAILENCYNKNKVEINTTLSDIDSAGFIGYMGGTADVLVKNCSTLADSGSTIAAIWYNRNVNANFAIENSYHSQDLVNSGMVLFNDADGNPLNIDSELSQVKTCATDNPYELYLNQQTNLQVGISSGSSSNVTVDTTCSLKYMNVLRNIGLQEDDYLSKIDELMNDISLKQTQYGAANNRLLSAMEEISVQYENLVSSRSTIQDADMGEVSATYIQQQILQQASATLMATANQTPALALQLL